ncbi:MAG: methyltransferase domain-containing protein [Anaerolineales bacterium]|nr:methyltransferase domain-containing protein [Anaerolineales bacterium]
MTDFNIDTRADRKNGTMENDLRQLKERSIWDKMASGYDRRTLNTYRRAYDLSIDRVRSIVYQESHVLEIGCGTGIVTLGVAPFVKSIIATDISPEMIEIAKTKAREASVENVTFRICDGYNLQEADGVFDTILLFNVLHIVKEPQALLREANRLLKPDGTISSATDCYAEPAPLIPRIYIAVLKLFKAFGKIPFMWFYTAHDLEQKFLENGFDIIKTENLHPAPVNYYILAQKRS